MDPKTMDLGHWNCRDYYISPDAIKPTVSDALHSMKQKTWEVSEMSQSSPVNRLPTKAPPFPFLRLPLELRQKIVSYLLPSASTRNADSVRMPIGHLSPREPVQFHREVQIGVWERGLTALLCVCRQLHDECAALMYGNSVFGIFVTFSSITVRFRWLLPSGLAPSSHHEFLELVAQRYLRLVRQLDVTIDHPDSYTGMIKFNVGGKGLTHGLKDQVQTLVDALQPGGVESDRRMGRLNTLRIKLLNGNDHLDREKRSIVKAREDIVRGVEEVQTVLEPFSGLDGIARVDIQGAVTVEYAHGLRDLMCRK